MKRTMIALLLAAVAVTAASGCTKGYETQKTSGDITIGLTASSYPLIKGDNSMAIKVTDASGKPVTNARLDIRYSMPPMPGMAPMDYTAQPSLKGDVYVFTANIAMEGGWKVDVSVARPDKPAQTATFNVDAR